MDSNHRSLSRRSRFSLRKANCGDGRGAPRERCFFYGVPMVRIHVPPARSPHKIPLRSRDSKVSPPSLSTPICHPGREMLWGGRQGNGNFVAASNRWSAPMPQPNDLSRSLVALDQNSTIIAVIEMSQSSWLVGGVLPGIERQCAAPGAGEERAETARHYTPRRNSIMAAFTSATRSCWVQWPQPGNIIVARSADTKFERFGISPSMPGKLTTGSRSPAM